ncbi:MAG: hypothetical protein ACBR21_05745 [Microcoleus sp.]
MLSRCHIKNYNIAGRFAELSIGIEKMSFQLKIAELIPGNRSPQAGISVNTPMWRNF